MPPRDKSDPRHADGATGTRADRAAGRQQHDTSKDRPDPLPVADGLRAVLEFAGIDREPLGIRDRGPLNWEPDDVPAEGPPAPPVAIARRAVLAHGRRVDLDRQLWIARWFLREFGRAV